MRSWLWHMGSSLVVFSVNRWIYPFTFIVVFEFNFAILDYDLLLTSFLKFPVPRFPWHHWSHSLSFPLSLIIIITIVLKTKQHGNLSLYIYMYIYTCIHIYKINIDIFEYTIFTCMYICFVCLCVGISVYVYFVFTVTQYGIYFSLWHITDTVLEMRNLSFSKESHGKRSLAATVHGSQRVWHMSNWHSHFSLPKWLQSGDPGVTHCTVLPLSVS